MRGDGKSVRRPTLREASFRFLWVHKWWLLTPIGLLLLILILLLASARGGGLSSFDYLLF